MKVHRMFTGKTFESGRLIQIKPGDTIEIKRHSRDKVIVLLRDTLVTVERDLLEKCAK